jgi:hypothetical protein
MGKQEKALRVSSFVQRLTAVVQWLTGCAVGAATDFDGALFPWNGKNSPPRDNFSESRDPELA